MDKKSKKPAQDMETFEDGDGEVVMCSVSLFSGGGLGDLGVQYGAGVPVIAMCELLEERAHVLRSLFPDANVVHGDIWDRKDDLVSAVRRRIGVGRRPWLLVMSPPCQGMSSNGVGRISDAVARGIRPETDERNRLLLPAIDVVLALRPECVIVENVRHMQRTNVPNEFGDSENLISMLRRRLAEYTIEEKVLNAAEFGVPQRRERLITVACRTNESDRAELHLHPPPSHGPRGSKPFITFDAATSHLPPLHAQTKLSDTQDDLHAVPRWNDMQLFCMSHTGEGRTAFDNSTCVACGTDTEDRKAWECVSCGFALPRPIKTVCSWRCS